MKTIFFDLDGTLTDPKAGITRSIQYALEALDRPVPEEDDLIWCIGPPLLDSLKKILGDDPLANAALTLYRERFNESGLYENHVYAGIEEVLKTFCASGHPLYVATSKPVVYAERIMEHFSLSAYFERVFGSELDGTRADKTELLAYALAETDFDAEDCIMIGDRSHDMIGARNNRMTAIGVLYGYGSEEELSAAGAHRIAATSEDLPETVG